MQTALERIPARQHTSTNHGCSSSHRNPCPSPSPSASPIPSPIPTGPQADPSSTTSPIRLTNANAGGRRVGYMEGGPVTTPVKACSGCSSCREAQRPSTDPVDFTQPPRTLAAKRSTHRSAQHGGTRRSPEEREGEPRGLQPPASCPPQEQQRRQIITPCALAQNSSLTVSSELIATC